METVLMETVPGVGHRLTVFRDGRPLPLLGEDGEVMTFGLEDRKGTSAALWALDNWDKLREVGNG